jgi:hypothetical protein
LTLVLCACGDDDVSTVDAGRGDSGAIEDDAGAARDSGTSDGGGPDAGPLPSCEPARLLVTTSDYVTGRVGTIDLETFAVDVTTTDSPDQDSLPDGSGCSAFVLERALGHVRIVSSDPLAAGVTVDLNEPGVTMIYAANPSRVIAVAPNKAYALLQGRSEIAVFDPSAAAPVVTTIDLSAFDDPDDTDGSVDAVDAILVNGRLIVALGRYWFDDEFMIHFEGSLLAAIDVTTDEIVDFDSSMPGVQGIDLAGENPWRGLRLREDGVLLVGSAGDSFAFDGGIEAVDLEAGVSMGLVLTEEEIGNELNGFVPDGLDSYFVIAGLDLVHVAPGGAGPDIARLRAGTDGIFATDDWVLSWSRMTDPGLRAHSIGDRLEVTPGAVPIEVGDLPIYGVALIH